MTLVLEVEVKCGSRALGNNHRTAGRSGAALDKHRAAEGNSAAESDGSAVDIGGAGVSLGAESGLDRSSLGRGCVNGNGDTVGVSDAHNRAGASAGGSALGSNLRRTSVRANSRRVDK